MAERSWDPNSGAESDDHAEDLARAIVARAGAATGTSPATPADLADRKRRHGGVVALAALLTFVVPAVLLSLFLSFSSGCVERPGSGATFGVKMWDWSSLSYTCSFSGGSVRNEGPGWWAGLGFVLIAGSVGGIIRLTRRPCGTG